MIVWSKPNPMPELVTDRPTSAYEHVFLLTKSARYFYDAEAVREVADGDTHSRGVKRNPPIDSAGVGHKNWASYMTHDDQITHRNLRNVWTLPTSPYSEAHFATFPPALAERGIRAGTSERGCCSACGAPWRGRRTHQGMGWQPLWSKARAPHFTGRGSGSQHAWQQRRRAGRNHHHHRLVRVLCVRCRCRPGHGARSVLGSLDNLVGGAAFAAPGDRDRA